LRKRNEARWTSFYPGRDFVTSDSGEESLPENRPGLEVMYLP
jgi:hypothetical protein